jgi:hypothetical protein
LTQEAKRESQGIAPMNTLTLKKYDNEDEFNDLLKSSPKKKPKNQSHFKDKEWESLEALTSN